MGNRKQPFGYRVVMGEIALHPQESKLVEYIFQQYLAGATYNTLVEELREQSIPYDEGKLWNKNMVARILEDSRYTGERGYPPVIDREALEKALEKRSAKQTAAPKTDTQKLLRRFSGRPSTARMERQVLDLLQAPKRIGLTLTAGGMLVPEKSITALVGLSDRQEESCGQKCMRCQKKNCAFRCAPAEAN